MAGPSNLLIDDLERVSGMKKWMRLVCVFLCVLLVGGCAAPSPAGESQPQSTDDSENGSFLVKIDGTDKIVLKLPSVDREDPIADILIKDYVCGVLNTMTGISFDLTQTQRAPTEDADWYENGYTGYAIRLGSRVTQCDDTLVSIVFEGMLNNRSAAHPTQLFFTLNYNPQTNRTVAFSDIYSLDDSLYASFLQAVRQKTSVRAGDDWKTMEESFLNEYCSQDDFNREMTRKDIFRYYFTETGIGVGFPVPHAVGDYVEVEISQGDM